MIKRLSCHWLRFAQTGRAFGRDRRGLAAIEFAMLLPIMLVTLFGVIGATSAIAIDRKVTLMARTLADLTAQGDDVSNNDISNFFAIGRAMLTPYSATMNAFTGGPLKMTLTELYIDPATGAARVQWSKGDDERSAGSVVTMPSGLIGRDSKNEILPNQYFILSEVSYRYAPSILPGVASVNLSETTYTRPRVTSRRPCVLYQGTSNCPK